MTFDSPEFISVLDQLASLTGQLENDGAWPTEQFKLLGDAKVLGWLIPKQYGGSELSAAEVTDGYFALSKACLVTAFVLTQRNAAVQRIITSDNEAAKQKFLPKLCTADMFTTVGLSHLTTSRQHTGKPSVQIAECEGGYRVNGFIPWTSGATNADYVMTGGIFPDGQQALAMVETSTDGFQARPPMKLLALNASHTGAADLKDVFVPTEDLIAGPSEAVLKTAKSTGTGSLSTSALALGSAANSLAHIQQEADRRSDLVPVFDQLAMEHNSIVSDMRRSFETDANPNDPDLTSESIRQRANSFVLRCSQAFLAASKGAGFAKGHPAERAVREAMFFMVWSCPQPVLNANLRELACMIE